MNKQLTADDIRAWRKTAELTQVEFAHLLGLSRITIARMETNRIPVPKWMSLAREGWKAAIKRQRHFP